MASKLRTIRQGLRDRLKTISGLSVYEDWPNDAKMPCAIVEFVSAEHDQTFGSNSTHDLAIYRFEAIVGVSMAGGLPQAQEQLDDYESGTGTKSVRAALASDRTLGGTVASLFLGPWDRISDEEISAQNYLVHRLPIDVWST